MVMRSGAGAKPISLTKAPVRTFTPRGRSQAANGSMNAWRWQYGVRRMFFMSERFGNKYRKRFM